jgi:hypothetical protein
MKVSEKTLELNVGAELLTRIRTAWGLPKAYLRGLTQREEKLEGVDFFLQMSNTVRIFAFQFKAPRGSYEVEPYRYTIKRDQHDLLFSLAQLGKSAVFYVLPFYLTPQKLESHVPLLLQDTWVSNIAHMPTASVFGSYGSRTLTCQAGKATVNPEFELQLLSHLELSSTFGISVRSFDEWYRSAETRQVLARRSKNPWLVRGLRLAVTVSERGG